MSARQFLKIIRNYSNMPCIFKLIDYDVIGLDLDNTLLEYNLANLFKLQYNFLANYLTEKKGYNKTIFSKNLSESDTDFIQRGLFMDFARGNLLNLRSDGYIMKATHGTMELDSSLIEQLYGKDRKWSVTAKLVDNPISIWDCAETRAFLDFTDSVATLLYAKAVDSVDLQGKPIKYEVWPDLLEALVKMYDTESNFMQTIASNLLDYLKPCDKHVLTWLKDLKKHAKLILITGAEYKVAQITLPLCLGQNYNEFFDVIIYDANKPGFFNEHSPFLSTENKPVKDIVLGKHYRQGNWFDLYKTLELYLNKTPKCVYVGDNPLQDIFTPTKISEKMDVIALIEEVAGEGLYPGYSEHPYSKYISSKFWGSFLYSNQTYTFIGSLIKYSSQLVIPSLKVLAEKPIYYALNCILNADSLSYLNLL